MIKNSLAAVAVAAVPFMAVEAQAKTIITADSGNASIEITYPLLDYALWGTAAAGSPPATVNDAGNPVVQLPIQASRGSDFSRGSQVIDGGYALRFNGGVYLFPLADAADTSSELASFETVKVFGEIPDDVDVPRAIRFVNFDYDAATGVYTNHANGEVVDLTAEQAALLVDGEVRSCCRNVLSALRLNTVTGELTGRINNVRDRPTDLLFNLGAETAQGTELLVGDYLAEMLTYGYSAWNADFPLIDQWGYSGTIPNLAGEVIGYISYDIQTSVIPVPAALPLLLGGLGALGVFGARRKKAA